MKTEIPLNTPVHITIHGERFFDFNVPLFTKIEIYYDGNFYGVGIDVDE